MKIGIIADVHANVYGLKAVLKKLKNTDLILCAGDIIGYYNFVNEVFDELKKSKVQWIRGNFDNFLFQHLPDNKIIQESIRFTQKKISKENLNKLKKAKTHFFETIDGLKIMMFHETPRGTGYVYPDFKQFDKFQNIDADVIILGHTHYPMIRLIGKKIVINPGSCGQPRDYQPKVSYAILDTKTRKASLHRVDYDRRKVISKVRELGFDQSLIKILKRQK